MKEKKNNFQLAHEKLYQNISKKKKSMTNKSFKGQNVFVHDEDGSYFLFEDAIWWHTVVEVGDNYHSFDVVFPQNIEPHVFYPSCTETCHVYGEEIENTWDKTKIYRPKRVRKPAADYLRKNRIELDCGDFDLHAVMVKIGWDVTMHLMHAKVVEENDTVYIFTEHHGYYAFKKKDITWMKKIE